jgi:hypothetical protein
VPSKKKAKPTQGNVGPKSGISGNTEKPEKKTGGRARSLQNLKRFQPGQSGNPSGRPKNPLTDAVRHRLGQLVPNDRERRDWAAAGY